MNLLELTRGYGQMEFTEVESGMNKGSILIPHFIFNFIIIMSDQFYCHLIFKLQDINDFINQILISSSEPNDFFAHLV